MKRLLLPLLAALALPTAVSAGDLGAADYLPRGSRDKNEELVELSKQNKFKLRCGVDVFEAKRRTEPCYLEFKNGLLTIDNSEGIKPSQVLYFERFSDMRVTFFYRTNNNKVSIASFHPSYKLPKPKESRAFLYRFIDWLGSEKLDN